MTTDSSCVNSKGCEVHPTALGRSAFQRWFRGSAVVDKLGRPLVVYHATAQNFNAFETDRQLGAHFGTEAQARKIASYFTSKGKPGANTIAVYLNIQKPLLLKDEGTFVAITVVPQLRALGLLPQNADPENFRGTAGMAAMRHAIRDAGYDGVMYENTREGEGLSWIALDAQQIKSAIGNDGSFLPNDRTLVGQDHPAEREMEIRRAISARSVSDSPSPIRP